MFDFRIFAISFRTFHHQKPGLTPWLAGADRVFKSHPKLVFTDKAFVGDVKLIYLESN